uniref:C-type lectin domain-containing protein n=1 Tax=Cyprinodon variegatus TaxID=28743 RepID=A0A3Q2G6Q6_CYPVA
MSCEDRSFSFTKSCSFRLLAILKFKYNLFLGWSFADVNLGWTYHYSTDTMNWTEARKWCQTHFTDLVVIQSDKENAYIASLLPTKDSSPYYWIGITKKQINETWSWVGNNKFCVEMYVNSRNNHGKWNDEKCANKKYAVCYKGDKFSKALI